MKDYGIFLMDYSIHDYVVYTVVTYIYLSPIESFTRQLALRPNER